LRNATVGQVADVIAAAYQVPVDLLEQYGKAFACHAVEEVADYAAEAVEEELRKVAPDLDDKTAEGVVLAVWAAVAVSVENLEWRL
jgi:hypothetical protein